MGSKIRNRNILHDYSVIETSNLIGNVDFLSDLMFLPNKIDFFLN